MKKRIFLIFLACLLAFTSFSADAHPGRLDAHGGLAAKSKEKIMVCAALFRPCKKTVETQKIHEARNIVISVFE